jgi:hypothetical protein
MSLAAPVEECAPRLARSGGSPGAANPNLPAGAEMFLRHDPPNVGLVAVAAASQRPHSTIGQGFGLLGGGLNPWGHFVDARRNRCRRACLG